MRLSNQQRIVAFNFFNDNKFNGIKYIYFVVSNALKTTILDIHINFLRTFKNFLKKISFLNVRRNVQIFR
jgi:hypothetical protein